MSTQPILDLSSLAGLRAQEINLHGITARLSAKERREAIDRALAAAEEARRQAMHEFTHRLIYGAPQE